MIALIAPDKYVRGEGDLMIFLAGGITGCDNWQEEVIDELNKYNFDDHVIVLSPRCEKFDITDKNASINQIKWEFKYLCNMDFFSMYFCNSESVQPICMYELGRYISDMCHRFPVSVKDRILVGVEDGYKREFDVQMQTNLALGEDVVCRHMSPKEYAHKLAAKIQYLLLECK